jgi:ParB/RepB/Spo0J family partition protein
MLDTTIPVNSAGIFELDISRLLDSPSNPRKHYSDTSLAELADSIKAVGSVLEPLLARPLDGPGGFHELVFGHRRKRAAERAGLTTVPCMVRPMSDSEVLLAQLHENMQREDCTPLEEADGIARLMRDHQVKADDVAQQLGISRRQVYSRLKLADAAPEVRKALQEGAVGVETANAIARVVGHKLQAQALKEALEHVHQDGRGYRDTVAALNDKFTTHLKAAIFDREAADLVPDAGSCTACPKRSGNAPELFGDLAGYKDPDYQDARTYHGRIWLKNAGPDVCTDPTCFQAKHKAHLAKVAAELEAKGKAVVTGNAAKTALTAQGEVKLDGPLVPADRVRDLVKKLPAGERPEQVTVLDQRTGKTVQAFRRKDLGTSVATAAADTHERKGARSAAQAAQAQQEREEREAEDAQILDAMREALHATPLASAGGDLFWLRRMVHLALGACNGTDTLQRWQGDTAYALQDQLHALGAKDLNKILLDTLLADDADDYSTEYTGAITRIEEAAKHLGVDIAAIRVQARAQRQRAAEEAQAAAAAESASTPSTAARAAKGAAKGKGPAIAYRNPLTGETWTGRGLQPKWLKVALAGGKTLADFAVGAAPTPTVAPAGAWPFPNKKEGADSADTPSPAARAAKKGKGKPGAATQADLGLESTLAADQGKKNSLTKPAEAGEVCQE